MSQVPFPALTICSQGWVPEVVESVMKKELHDYIISKGRDISNVSDEDLSSIETLFADNFTKEFFPGATIPVPKMITLLASQDPDVALLSEVMISKGYDECANMATMEERGHEATCTDGTISWKGGMIETNGVNKTVCMSEDALGDGLLSTSGEPLNRLAAAGLSAAGGISKAVGVEAAGVHDGDSCVRLGANRLRFSLEDSTLHDVVFEEYCSYQDNCKTKSRFS